MRRLAAAIAVALLLHLLQLCASGRQGKDKDHYHVGCLRSDKFQRCRGCWNLRCRPSRSDLVQ